MSVSVCFLLHIILINFSPIAKIGKRKRPTRINIPDTDEEDGELPEPAIQFEDLKRTAKRACRSQRPEFKSPSSPVAAVECPPTPSVEDQTGMESSPFMMQSGAPRRGTETVEDSLRETVRRNDTTVVETEPGRVSIASTSVTDQEVLARSKCTQFSLIFFVNAEEK